MTPGTCPTLKHSSLCPVLTQSPLPCQILTSLWSQPLPIPSQETFPNQLSHARPSFLEVLSIWPSTSYYSLFILRDTLEVKRPSRSLAGTCLVIQWLRLHPPNARDPSLIPHQGTISHKLQLRIHKLQLRIHMLQLKKKKKSCRPQLRPSTAKICNKFFFLK